MVVIGHVGDSRAYVLRDGTLEQLTDDHSLVAELVRRGELSPEEAEVHPQRSVITRALGTDPSVDVDAFSVPGPAGRHLPPLLRRPHLDGRRRYGRADPRSQPGRSGGSRAGPDQGGERSRRRGQHHHRPLRRREATTSSTGRSRPRPSCPSRTRTSRTRCTRRTTSRRRPQPPSRPRRPPRARPWSCHRRRSRGAPGEAGAAAAGEAPPPGRPPTRLPEPQPPEPTVVPLPPPAAVEPAAEPAVEPATDEPPRASASRRLLALVVIVVLVALIVLLMTKGLTR